MKKAAVSLSITIGLFLAFLTVPVQLHAAAEEKINESYQVDPGGTLKLNSELGSVEIRTHTKDRVDIQILKQSRRARDKKALDEFYIRTDKSGNDVIVTGNFKKHGLARLWSRLRNRLRVKYIISVPDVYDLDLRTAGGSIDVDGIQGDIAAQSTGGGLHFREIKGDLRGRTTGGSIRLKSLEGNADLGTTGGGIETGYIAGSITAHTTGGSITIQKAEGFIRARTTGGSIKAAFAVQPKQDCYLKTTGGSVTVHMESGLSFDIDARTTGGRVNSDFPISLEGRIGKRAITGRMNGGGPELYLRSSGGSINLRSY